MYLCHSSRRSLRRLRSLSHRLITFPCHMQPIIHRLVTRSLVQACEWDLAAKIKDIDHSFGSGFDVKVAYYLGWQVD